MELPFDDDEVDPLQADDPRPQRVPQFPAGSRRSRRQGPGGRANSDRELASRFDTANEYSDPGYAPAFLYVERGPGAGQLVPVKQGALVIGRSSSSDLRLQHPSISRRHAHLTRRGERFFLKDLSSQNGTFLNRHRITSEVELMPGDEVSLGNALLRLRGPGGTPALGVPAVSHDEKPPSRGALSTVGVALGAAALGSGVAALIALLSMRMAGGAEHTSPVPPPAAPQHAAAASPTVVASGAPTRLDMEVPAAGSAEKTGDTAVGAATATTENPPPEAENAPLTPKATGISALNVARGTTKQVRPVAVAPSNKRAAGARDSAAAPSDATSAKEAEVLRRYEAGDLAAARDLAQAEKLTALHGQLIRFETAEAQAKKALAQRDFPEAIAQLTLAISVDDALAHGWSKHGPPLRKQLSRLHVQVGTEHAAAGRVSEARAAFEQALKHDTGNREAREQLGRLTGASAP
ncbi:FHA domain-containing protein [Myxococcus xanthus]|uniref:FHA domain-containing protein n=1 Tax=Myxococcus xanthus TaxID=34 RepID=UPI00031D2F5B|nr:FHA domain-containing protein [Myxococcus xanthus]NOJ57998.1 FHA domain-containing protein [Myxococcus xanthus]UYI24752.1 FHA domain-containing protein [Myxococcus xanthus]